MNSSSAIPSTPNPSPYFFEPLPKLDYIWEREHPKSILLSFNGKVKAILLNDIIRLEASSSYTLFFIIGLATPLLKSKPLKYYAQQLNSDQFIRVHKSHLVNQHFIQSYHLKNKRFLTLKNGHKISISRRKLAELKMNITIF